MPKEISDGEREQNERIMEALKDYQENPDEYDFFAFEDIFEDRDPTEFL